MTRLLKSCQSVGLNRVKKCMGTNENLEKIQALVVGTEWPEFKDAARQLSGLKIQTY